MSRFYNEEIMNIDFDEDRRKLPTKSFLKYSRELSTHRPTNFIVISTPSDKLKKHI